MPSALSRSNPVILANNPSSHPVLQASEAATEVHVVRAKEEALLERVRLVGALTAGKLEALSMPTLCNNVGLNLSGASGLVEVNVRRRCWSESGWWGCFGICCFFALSSAPHGCEARESCYSLYSVTIGGLGCNPLE